MRYLCVTLIALLLPALSLADIYRWIDENGTPSYGQTPPEGVETQRINRATQPAPGVSNQNHSINQIRAFLDKSTAKSTSRSTPKNVAAANKTGAIKAPQQLERDLKDRSQRRHNEVNTAAEKRAGSRSREVLNTFRNRGNLTNQERSEQRKDKINGLRKKPASLSKKMADKAARP